MSTGDCIVGRHACGCVTYANASPDRMDRETQKAIAEFVRDGGEILRITVEEARAMPHFLVSECPHEPKGWAPAPPPPEAVSRCKSVSGRDTWVVYTKTKHSGGWPSGFVRKYEKKWWATEGWFDYDGPGAHDYEPGQGDQDERKFACEIFGPFDTKKAAVAVLTPIAIEKSKAFSERAVGHRVARARPLTAGQIKNSPEGSR